MEAKELRIGNYVKFWNNILCIDELNNSTVKASSNEFGSVSEKYEDISPIILTEEWLLRFDWKGYKPLHFNSNFEIDKQGRLYCNGDYKGVNVNYVHQLQNLYFALTGKELKTQLCHYKKKY